MRSTPACSSTLDLQGYRFSVAQTGSGEQDPSSLVLEYVGYWNWDFALFLERAEIRAYEDGRRVGKVEFRAPNSLNLSKFGEEPERIRVMMDVLFREISRPEPKRTRALGETRI